jgi:hypothetical protein
MADGGGRRRRPTERADGGDRRRRPTSDDERIADRGD